MEDTRTLVFVYGTLKRGLRNHHRMADQEFRGEAVTEPRYRVIDLGPHPGLILDEEFGLPVKGELFAVGDCCLGELDDFEEVPGPFIRGPVMMADGTAAQAYYWNQPVPDGVKTGDHWPL